ncbi:hypothetical protein HK105_206140 [Polyrhizophydium stewartii]|uniref:Mic1 domain-containing protein n=1 Tax=Polyrhizophydium stewartii TaxID=2732419 RepID=A0ABR4N4E3_9FUNG
MRGHLRSIRLSPDRLFVGILRSAKEVRLTSSPMDAPPALELVRDWKSSDAILGFEWTFPGELFCVTNTGIEFYAFSDRRKTFSSKRVITMRVSWHLFSPDANLLVLSTGTPLLIVHQIKPGCAVSGLPSIKLETASGLQANQSNPAMITRKHVAFVSLYGDLFFAFFNTWNPDAVLALYHLGHKDWVLHSELSLIDRGAFSLNVWDNLLLVHNLTCKNTIIFDIQARQSAKMLTPPQTWLFSLFTALPSLDVGPTAIWSSHLPDLILSPSAGALSRLSVSLDGLRAEMERVKGTLGTIEILELLTRRSGEDAYALKLSVVRSLIALQPELWLVRCAFDVLNTTIPTPAGGQAGSRSMSKQSSRLSMSRQSSRGSIHYSGSGSRTPLPAGSSGGLLERKSTGLFSFGKQQPSQSPRHPSTHQASPQPAASSTQQQQEYADPMLQTVLATRQEDVYTHILAIFADSDLPASTLSGCILEYMDSLTCSGHVAEQFVEELLCGTLLRDGAFAHITQLLQMQVLSPSQPLARLLMDFVPTFEPFAEIVVEMLSGLGADGELLSFMVSRGELLRAIKHAIDRGLVHHISPAVLLEAAYSSGNPTVFLNIYRALEEHGLIPVSAVLDLAPSADELDPHRNAHREMQSSDEVEHLGAGVLARYVSVFRELWGPRIDMENI